MAPNPGHTNNQGLEITHKIIQAFLGKACFARECLAVDLTGLILLEPHFSLHFENECIEKINNT